MARLFGCRICRIELARIELADGTVALVCSTCDVIGLEHEAARGGPLRSGGSRSKSRSAATLGR